MGFGKFINLDEKGFKIWKKKFGSYSQEFSKWICDKLKEEDLQNTDTDEKWENIEKERIELEKKLESVKNEGEKLQEVKEKEEKIKEELEQMELAKKEEIKKNFFNHGKDVHNLKEEEIKQLYEEFKKQDLGIILYFNEKYGVENGI